MEELVSTFSERLAELKRILNLSNNEIAHAAGVNQSNIGRYLSGRYKMTQDGICNLCDYYNVEYAWLMGADCDMYKKKTSANSGLSVKELEILSIMSGMTESGVDQLLTIARQISTIYKAE